MKLTSFGFDLEDALLGSAILESVEQGSLYCEQGPLGVGWRV